MVPPSCRTTGSDGSVGSGSDGSVGSGSVGSGSVAAAIAPVAADAQRAAFVRPFRMAGYGVIGGLLLVAVIAPLLARRAKPDQELLSAV